MRKLRLFLTTICMIIASITCMEAATRYINLTLTYDNKKHDYTAEEVFVAIDGLKLKNLPMQPIILNGYTLVPAREVFEAVGAEVEWKKDLEQVYITYGSKLVVIPINSSKSYINGIATIMQTDAKIINNKTMIPLRFVSTAVGFDVQWDKNTRVANIITKSDSDVVVDEDIDFDENKNQDEDTTITETTTEVTTIVETEETTTVKQEDNSNTVNINSIDFSSRDAKDYITIEGSGPLTPQGKMSEDKTYFNITIPNANLPVPNGNIGNGTYVKSGFYYQNGTSVDFSLTVRENVDLSFDNYGNKTVITINYSPNNNQYEGNTSDKSNTSDVSNDSITPGYNEETGELTLCSADAIDINKMVHSDDYYNLIYTITIPGDYTNVIKSQTHILNNDYIDAIYVDAGYNETKIIIDENRIMACKVYTKNGAVIIKPCLPKEKYDKIIVLDAGHGGDDPGASGQGLVEKNLTLNMLLKAKALFDNDGKIKCYVTRATDTYPTFDDRTNLANEVGDAFISIHINSASNASAKGTETYQLNPNDQGNGLTSYMLAESLLNNLLDNLGTVNRKVKSANFIVLRQTNVPASLIEIGFISNASDAAIMKTDSGQQATAKAIFDSVTQLFNEHPPVR